MLDRRSQKVSIYSDFDYPWNVLLENLINFFYIFSDCFQTVLANQLLEMSTKPTHTCQNLHLD